MHFSYASHFILVDAIFLYFEEVKRKWAYAIGTKGGPRTWFVYESMWSCGNLNVSFYKDERMIQSRMAVRVHAQPPPQFDVIECWHWFTLLIFFDSITFISVSAKIVCTEWYITVFAHSLFCSKYYIEWPVYYYSSQLIKCFMLHLRLNVHALVFLSLQLCVIKIPFGFSWTKTNKVRVASRGAELSLRSQQSLAPFFFLIWKKNVWKRKKLGQFYFSFHSNHCVPIMSIKEEKIYFLK